MSHCRSIVHPDQLHAGRLYEVRYQGSSPESPCYITVSRFVALSSVKSWLGGTKPVNELAIDLEEKEDSSPLTLPWYRIERIWEVPESTPKKEGPDMGTQVHLNATIGWKQLVDAVEDCHERVPAGELALFDAERLEIAARTIRERLKEEERKREERR